MIVIGLAGGVASGKSAVAAMFAQLGAVVMDADAIGHAVLHEPEVVQAAQQRWGSAILHPDGSLSRAAIAHIVFAPDHREELEFWQRVTHPRITAAVMRRLAECRRQATPPPAVVLDAALLFEAGWDSLCDLRIFVEVPENQRKQRARSRGWTDAEFAAREARQLPTSQKRAQCHLVIDNSGTMEQTYNRVLEAWNTYSHGT
jgi:dephospho-CoA kinase